MKGTSTLKHGSKEAFAAGIHEGDLAQVDADGRLPGQAGREIHPDLDQLVHPWLDELALQAKLHDL
jgi:hypothetical protein